MDVGNINQERLVNLYDMCSHSGCIRVKCKEIPRRPLAPTIRGLVPKYKKKFGSIY